MPVVNLLGTLSKLTDYMARQTDLVQKLEAIESGIVVSPDGTPLELPADKLTALRIRLNKSREKTLQVCQVLNIEPVYKP